MRPLILSSQAAQPAYMKTNSGRVLEMPKTEEGPTTQQELQELTATYEATVRLPATLLRGHFDTGSQLARGVALLVNLVQGVAFKAP